MSDDLVQEIGRLLATDELRIGLLVTVIGSAGAVLKLAPWLVALCRKRAYKGYSSSISFGQDEVQTALTGYVSHEGMESDPSNRFDLADALAVKRRPLFDMLDNALLSPSGSKYVFVFADCGMGKTTFLINYFHRRRSSLRRRKMSIVLVSLSRAGYLSEISDIAPDLRSETVLLMDAFDEDPLVLDGVGERLKQIVDLTSSFRSVVITCRSQFFSSNSEIPVGTGALRAGPTPAGKSKEYEFHRIYIAPFDEKRVRQYLRTSFGGPTGWLKRRRASAMVHRVPSLVMRPMLLAHISDVLESESREGFLNQADIYQAIVSAWVKREAAWVDAKLLLDFSKKFALDIFGKRHARGGEHCSRAELVTLAKAWGVNIRAELLTGRSLLNRTEDGRCKFAHRSIMEYLVSRSILEGLTQKPIELTRQIASFLFNELGVESAFPEGRLDSGAVLLPTQPENRLGYPTNYNLYHESRDLLDPVSVYGLWTRDELDGEGPFGEHIQYMIDHLVAQGAQLEVRISTAPAAGDELVAHVSVWTSDAASLSLIYISRAEWSAVVGDGWLGRGIYNIVGRPTFRGSNSSDLEFKTATKCNFPADLMGVDSANACQVISAHLAENDEKVIINVIPGFEKAGPLCVFGVLSGGSLSHLRGKKSRLLHRRDIAEESRLPAEGLVAQELPLVTAAERWPSGWRN